MDKCKLKNVTIVTYTINRQKDDGDDLVYWLLGQLVKTGDVRTFEIIAIAFKING